MHCPYCARDKDKVIDSCPSDSGDAIRRRRECIACGKRFTTYERIEEVPLVVVKSDGTRQPFDRAKVIAGISAAAKGRPVAAEAIEQIAEEVEDEARLHGGDVPSRVVGLAVLERLRSLDEVVYLRFASVYKSFDAAADFQRELVLLEKMQSQPG